MLNTEHHRRLKPLMVAILAGTLGGCSFVRPFTDGDEMLRNMPRQLAEDPEQAERVIETAAWGDSVLRARPIASAGALPMRKVEKLSVTEAGLYDVIQLLFDNTDLAVTFEGGTDNIRRYGPVTAYNLSGNLQDVMTQLGQSLGFFWSVNGKSVTIEAEQQFVVDLPPVLNDDNLAGITNTLQYLGVRDSYLDRNERRLVFRANRKALQAAENYLARLRETRSMIIYDAQILQVDLKDAKKLGIQWSAYGKRDPSVSAFSKVDPSSGASGFDITLVGNSFSGSSLIEFLKSQGTVKSLSKPKVGLMSGTRGSLRVGNTTTIVSKVGRDLSTTVSQTTVETKDVRTGLEINLFGEEHDRTVYTRIALSITELLELATFEALGTKLSLPKIADREMRTQIRCRPGDTIILGGITINRGTNETRQGISIFSSAAEANMSELVVVLRPRLVMFRPEDSASSARLTLPTTATPAATPAEAFGISSPPDLKPLERSQTTEAENALNPPQADPEPAHALRQPIAAERPANRLDMIPDMRFTTPQRPALPGWRL